MVAKAERVDTTQLELEFATKLAELNKLLRKAEDEIGEQPENFDWGRATFVGHPLSRA